MASARISRGNTSLTVRYAELAAADARKNTADQHSACVNASSQPSMNAPPVSASPTPDST